MYSTAKEVHIAIISRLYQINSNRKRTYRPEEIDEAFNNAMIKFIEERSVINTNAVGLDETVKRQDDLKDLKISRKLVDVVVKPKDAKQVGRFVYAVLPNDYYKFEALELNINYECGRTDDEVNEIDLDVTYGSFTFAPLTTVTDYSLITFDDVTNTIEYFNSADENLVIKNKASHFMAVNSLIQACTRKALGNMYWERYLDLYIPNSFIMINDDVTDYELGINSTIVTPIDKTAPFKQFDYTANKLVPTELVQSKDLPDNRNNYYESKNRQNKPFIELEHDKLRINYCPAALPLSGYLTYIKKPIMLNLNANIMTDFVSHISEIIDLTVNNMNLTILGAQGTNVISNKNIQ